MFLGKKMKRRKRFLKTSQEPLVIFVLDRIAEALEKIET